MRVLIVDNDSEMLELTARQLRDGFSIDVVTSKADALDLLRQNELNVVVACEQLSDGSGLDLLSQAAKRWPETLRLFAASKDRMALLRGRLGPFKLFQTLDYPIDAGQLGSILMLAQAAQAADADTANVQHIVLGDGRAAEADAPANLAETAAAPNLAVARGAARPLPFTVASPSPPRPAARKRAARESFAPVQLVPPAAPKAAPAASPAPLPSQAAAPSQKTSQVLPALLKLRAGLHAMPSSVRSYRRQIVRALAVLGVLVAVGLGISWVAGDDPSATTPAANAAYVAKVDAVIQQIEAALTADDIALARGALERLRKLSPSHDRLPFFDKLVARREAAAAPRVVPPRKPEPLAAEQSTPHAAKPVQLAAEELRAPALTAAMGVNPEGATGFRQASASGLAEPGESAVPLASSSRTPPPPPAAGGSADPQLQLTPQSAEPQRSARSAISPPQTTSAPPGLTREPAPPPPTFEGRTIESSDATVTTAASAPLVQRAGPTQAGEVASLEDVPPVVHEANLVRQTPAEYPAAAAARGTEGFVDVAFTIGADGRVRETLVIASTPPGVFDRAALAAVRAWRYEPRREDGAAVDWRTQVRIEFKLQ